MADRTPADSIRRAVTALTCQHRHPITPVAARPPCEHCGLPSATTWRAAGLVGKELRGPLADLLAAVVEVWPDDQPVHDNGSCASRRRVAALDIANIICGEADHG